MLHGNSIAPGEAAFAFTHDTVSHPGADYIVVPDAHLLFHAEFKRAGDDLKLIGDDGKTFLVADYFKSEYKLKLVSPDGAGLTADVIEALAGPATPGQYAQAGGQPQANELVGKVVSVQGFAQIVRNGVTIAANTGDAVLKGDVVQTGDGGAISIIFTDSTTFNLSANARMVINEFVYDPNGSSNGALINLVQGTIGFVAGQVAKTGDMKVKTPVATMGIRGTAVVVEISADNGATKFSVVFEQLTNHTGAFGIYDNSTGALLGTVSDSNVGWVVTPAGPNQVLAQQLNKSVDDIQKELAIINLVFQNQSIGQQLLNLTDPNNTKNTAIGTQFTISDRLDINHDDTGAPKSVTVTYKGEYGNNNNQSNYLFIQENHAPVARPDPGIFNDAQIGAKELGVTPGTVGTGDVMPNDFDPDNDPIHVSNVVSLDVPAAVPSIDAVTGAVTVVVPQGTLVVAADGAVTFTVNDNNPQVDALAEGEQLFLTFRYTIEDPFGAAASATLVVTITGTNDAPTVITATTTATGEFSETAAITSSDAQHQVSGTISFNDVDHSTVAANNLHHLDANPATPTLDSPTPSFVWTSGSQTLPLSQALIDTLTTQGNLSLTLSETTPADASAPTSGGVDWTYKIPDAALDFLAEGETLTVTYPVTIVDAYGASVTQDIVITVTGTNDRPVIAADATTHGVLESTGTGEPDTAQASTTGALAFTDVDLSDSHTVSAALLQNASWDGGTIPSDTMSALQLALTAEVETGVVGSDSTGSGAGTVSWSFSVAQHLLDFLGDGETMTLTYDVAIDDSSVASNATSLTQTVTVVVTGTNDRPVITALDDTAGVTEDDAAPLTATGNLAFTDADLTDHETASVQLVSALPSDGASISDDLNAALQSALTFSQETFNSNSGSAAWNFTLDNSLVQYLGADETITVTYSVGITDDSHASNADSATQTITITIAGGNDQPTISAVDVEGAVVEDGSSPTLTDSGSVTFTDVDATDHETAAIDFVKAAGGHGGTVSDELEATLANALTLTNSAFATNSGTIEWNFALDNSLVQYLGDGETVTATYTISVADNSGAVNATSEPQTVTITITGTDDAPVLSASLTEHTYIDTAADDSFPAVTGQLTSTDADLHDATTYGIAGGTPADFSRDSTHYDAAKAGAYGTLYLNTTSGDYVFVPNDTAMEALKIETFESFQLTATDGFGAADTKTLTIDVKGANDTPVVTGAVTADATEGGGAVTLDALANASDRDAGDTLLVVPPETLPAGVTYNAATHSFTLDPADPAYEYLAADQHLEVTVNYGITDGTATVAAAVTWTITGTEPPNAAPIITAANTINNLRDDDDRTSKFVLDTILFQDANSTGVVTVTFSVASFLTDGIFSYDAIEHDGVTGDVSLFGRSVTLTGTIADINAYLATGGLIFRAANTNDHTLTVTIDDRSGAPNAVTTKTITLDSHQSLQSDLSGWTIDGVSNLAFGSSDNAVVTAWDRLPSSGATTYDGGNNSAAGDTITLAFKTAQLEDILTNGGARNELQDYLDGNVGSGSSSNRTLDLSSSDWNSVVKNFEHAKLAIATGNSYVVYNAIGENLPDYKSGSTGDGNDNTLVGDASSNNVMNGQGGNDILVGRKGNDTLAGGAGADLLLGGAGNDTLTGGGDNDIMAGGSGNDTFVFAPNFGHDVITDFQHGADKIDLGIAGDFASVPTSGGALDFAAWLANQPFEQIGNDTLIHISANDTILLKNVAATTLSANDFIVHHPPLVG